MTLRAALVLLPVAVAGALACDPGTEAVVEGNRFRRTFVDGIGSLETRIEHNGWDHEAGGDLEVSYTIDVSFDRLAEKMVSDQVKGVWVVWGGERLFDDTGRYRQMENRLSSTYLTTTGIPIENSEPILPSRKIGHYGTTPFDVADYFPVVRGRGADGLHLEGRWTRKLDDTVPPGLYRLMFDLVFDTEDYGPKPWAALPFLGAASPELFGPTDFDPRRIRDFTKIFASKRYLPLIGVGKMQRAPHMPWILFQDIGVNANVGVVANEDRDRFGLSTRLRINGDLIIPPGDRVFHPGFVTVFPHSMNVRTPNGTVTVPEMVDHYLDFESGSVRAEVLHPDGVVQSVGPRRFAGISARRDGPSLEGGDFRASLDRWGKYTVTLEGEIHDLRGRAIHGGGHYDVWVGRWLTYSSTVKPGQNFMVGDTYPAKLEINPPCPADVHVVIDFYPQSDKARKRSVVIEERASKYGYYFPREGTPTLTFDEPGEYRADVRASYVSPDGAHWYGHQVSAGVVVGDASRVALHGMRSPDLGDFKASKVNEGLQARYQLRDESSMGHNPLDIVNCIDATVPFHAADVLHVSSTMSAFGNISSYLSVEPTDPRLRAEMYGRVKPSPLLSFQPDATWLARSDKVARLNMMSSASFILRDDEEADQFPILMHNRYGYPPFSFPESNDVEAYTYFSSIRPGFTAFVLASDSTPSGAYWSTSPNDFGGQFNAGANGDMPNDLYVNMAGLVYKDHARGTVDYASYVSSTVFHPKETNNDHVSAPMAEPLFKINGDDVWLGVAMGTEEVLEVGDRISTGLMLIPQVPATIRQRVTWPDGRQRSVEGRADARGTFKGQVFRLDDPGVYKVWVEAEHQGRTGKVFGSGDGVFHHYVLPRDGPSFLHIDLPPVSRYDATRLLEIPLRFPAGYSNPKVTYSCFFPGMIMDEGELPARDGLFVYRFLPSQFAAQFPQFDIVDFLTGEARLNDLVVFIFFVEATSPDGSKAYDVAKLLIRDGTLYHNKVYEADRP